MIFKIDLVNVLLGFSQNFLTIPIMNPLSWFMIGYGRIECAMKGYKNWTKVHVLSHRDSMIYLEVDAASLLLPALLSSVTFLYVASILTYNQVPYLYIIQIMHVLITVSSTSMCACMCLRNCTQGFAQ